MKPPLFILYMCKFPCIAHTAAADTNRDVEMYYHIMCPSKTAMASTCTDPLNVVLIKGVL